MKKLFYALLLVFVSFNSIAAYNPEMNPLRVGLGLEESSGVYAFYKFGRSDNVDAVVTDVWDGANPTDDQAVWLAPTAARIHTLVSSSADDDGSPAGLGARVVRVYYLPTWDSFETYEDVTMNGITGVAMANTAVMINRMTVLTYGATSVNVGQISATAATDSTVTAIIRASLGQTRMAIFGVPSLQKVCLTGGGGSMNAGGGASKLANGSLLINTQPETTPSVFKSIDIEGLQTTGTSSFFRNYNPYRCISGPALLKTQALCSGADCDISFFFQGFLVNNN